MIRVFVVELVTGTVKEDTDTAEAPIGELVRGPTWRTVGRDRVLGGVSGQLAVSISPPGTSTVVKTIPVIAWFPRVAGEEP